MYDNYIALDWAQANMAIAKLTQHGKEPTVIDIPANLKELKGYLSRVPGKRILTFEETTTSQWLFTELRSCVEEIIVCDPYRNKLLTDGAKTDRVDAKKLVLLLRGDLLKPVYHSADKFISFRKLVSGYKDLIAAGVRLKNQRSALFRAVGKGRRSQHLASPGENFVLEGIEEGIRVYEERKARYEAEFQRICKEHALVMSLESIPGIGVISAVKIAALVVTAERFPTKNHFFSYSGLVKHELLSGGKSYGRRASRYCRELKAVFKIGALSCIAPNSKSPLRAYYLFLIQEKRYAEHIARHAVARRLAAIVYGVMKTGKRFDPTKIKTA